MRFSHALKIVAVAFSFVQVALCGASWGQEWRRERRVILGPLPATVTIYGRPGLGVPWFPETIVWSRDPETRARQAIARQLDAIDYARWHARPLAVGPWLDPWFGDPALIWGWPYREAVEQPIGFRRIYDGRGGYSSGPVYADELQPPPADAGPVEVEIEVAGPVRDERTPRAAKRPDAKRSRFSW